MTREERSLNYAFFESLSVPQGKQVDGGGWDALELNVTTVTRKRNDGHIPGFSIGL